MTDLAALDAELDRFRGLTGPELVAEIPLERDTLRRFSQAIMDPDPVYLDPEAAALSRYQGLAAPPLYPVHAFRPRTTGEDPLAELADNPNADGSGGVDSVFFGLPPIESPFKRLLNGGNEISFYRALAVGETATARARYADITLKQGKTGPMLLVTIETTFRTSGGELLLVNTQTLIWR